VPDEAILIYDYEDLKKIGNDPGFPLDGYYVQMGDIDASASRGENNGEGFEPIGSNRTDSFRGTFDGRGFTIRGLYINRPNSDNVGLWGWVGSWLSGGGIIIGVNVIADTIIGHRSVGGLVGFVEMATITNSSISGNVYGTDQVGGLIGQINGLDNTIITNCYSTGYVSASFVGHEANAGGLVGTFYGRNNVIRMCYSTANVSGHYASGVGGLVGINHSLITQSFAIGRVSHTDGSNTGGLVGLNRYNGSISESYSVGMISTDNARTVGGLVGLSNDDPGPITNSFWDITTSGQSARSSEDWDPPRNPAEWGIGLPTAQMQQRSTYTNWDFVDVWAIDEGQGYPFLRSLGRPVYYHDNQPSPSPQADSPAPGVSRTTGTPGTPSVALRGRTLSVVSPAVNSNLQIRVVDLRGRTVARFNTVTTSTNNRFPLNNLSAGRYLVEVRDVNRNRVNVSPIMVR